MKALKLKLRWGGCKPKLADRFWFATVAFTFIFLLMWIWIRTWRWG